MSDTGTPTNAPGETNAPLPRRPRQETARPGDEIYERDIRLQVEADRQGEVVAIDEVEVLCERVGYRALRSFGSGSPRRPG